MRQNRRKTGKVLKVLGRWETPGHPTSKSKRICTKVRNNSFLRNLTANSSKAFCPISLTSHMSDTSCSNIWNICQLVKKKKPSLQRKFYSLSLKQPQIIYRVWKDKEPKITEASSATSTLSHLKWLQSRLLCKEVVNND